VKKIRRATETYPPLTDAIKLTKKKSKKRKAPFRNLAKKAGVKL